MDLMELDYGRKKSLLILMEKELTVVVLSPGRPSKVDRSAAYATRHIAKNLLRWCC
jgi:hypothetical protein